jgi:hypothetical protein
MTELIQLQIPFESLVNAIASLDLAEKRQLLEMLEDQLFEAEEESIEQDPNVLAEIEEARNAVKAGDYQTLQEYITARTESGS